MAHIAVLCPPFLGHLNPMLALAGELAARGHSLTLVAEADVAPRAAKAGIGFEAVGTTTHPPGSLSAALARIGAVRGLSGIGPVIRDTAARTAMLCREAPAVLTRIGADLVLADQLEAAGGLVAARLGLPWVSVANGLLVDREAGVPPPVTDFLPGPDPASWQARRDRGAFQVIDWMMRPLGRVIAAEAQDLPSPGERPWRTQADCLSPFAEISQTVEAFDFPRRAAPAALHHVGPLRPPAATEPGLGALDPGGAFLFVSLGTLLGRRLDIFTAVAQAARALGVRCLIAHCGGLDERQADGLRRLATVTDFAPQHAAIAASAGVVSHAGMNTVLDALAAAKPVLAIPLAFDHPAIAARLTWHGAGVVLPPRRLTSRRIGAALERALGNPSIRAGAARIAAAMRVAGGAPRGADIAEAVLRTGQPVSAELAA